VRSHDPTHAQGGLGATLRTAAETAAERRGEDSVLSAQLRDISQRRGVCKAVPACMQSTALRG
jgi:hypothetical protein